mmetsp:Transcript_18865/g.13515  ORF Transcript_18865/g.13515 Transcript_18865/m.13515 type:complete len:117 (+) Transcript_18865:91-441(+)|eukprot:CAMPEP_0116878726 /NCGR_PEP_ID=MMETSP0463-20121206/10471_1 /TAXON_ID=181622 /ORGANISM="Strombidinopsis sp, Strain SopsisLIS2011" /LENGTH=116 /DNA_ID=CAMNT_0004527225 /DNA_START=16 /DNA_END=366 /DNA_ORIENTATION=+
MIVKNNRALTDEYEISRKELGKGTYGTVKKAKHIDTGNIRAVKTIPKSKITNWDRFTTEVKILQTLDHPNVIKLYEYFEEAKYVHLVTELCTGGELFDKIVEDEYFTEKKAARTFK